MQNLTAGEIQRCHRLLEEAFLNAKEIWPQPIFFRNARRKRNMNYLSRIVQGKFGGDAYDAFAAFDRWEEQFLSKDGELWLHRTIKINQHVWWIASRNGLGFITERDIISKAKELDPSLPPNVESAFRLWFAEVLEVGKVALNLSRFLELLSDAQVVGSTEPKLDEVDSTNNYVLLCVDANLNQYACTLCTTVHFGLQRWERRREISLSISQHFLRIATESPPSRIWSASFIHLWIARAVYSRRWSIFPKMHRTCTITFGEKRCLSCFAIRGIHPWLGSDSTKEQKSECQK